MSPTSFYVVHQQNNKGSAKRFSTQHYETESPGKQTAQKTWWATRGKEPLRTKPSTVEWSISTKEREGKLDRTRNLEEPSPAEQPILRWRWYTLCNAINTLSIKKKHNINKTSSLSLESSLNFERVLSRSKAVLGSSQNEGQIFSGYQPGYISTYLLVLKVFKESILVYDWGF